MGMLRWREWLVAGRRVLLLFLAVALLLGGTLLWLGWRMVRQDRELAEQRLQQGRELAADLALAHLQKSLAHAEELVAVLAAATPAEFSKRAAATMLPDDSALIADSGSDMVAFPEHRLAFYPVVPAGRDVPAPLFAEADKLELQDKDFARALAALRPQLQSRDPPIRAAALMRVARIDRKQNLRAEALSAYREMLDLRSGDMEGVPAELIAHQQSMNLAAQPAEGRRHAAELLRALDTHRYAITRGVYEFYRHEAQAVLGSSGDSGDESLAGAAEALHALPRDPKNRSGRFLSGATLILWQGVGDRIVAMLLGPQWIAEEWPPDLKSTLAAYGGAIRLSDIAGQTLFGPALIRPGREALRLAAVTHLPWNLHALTVDPDASLAPAKRRQVLVFASMAAIAALLLIGSYLMARTIARELALSRLQSDFVSAISHEFRTPLTSLCLLSEQLASGRVTGEADREEYFGVLARESQRLRRLVEGLLNFGRMEAGTAQYRFETIDPAELVESVSREFEQDREARGHRIEIHAEQDVPLVRADRAALACAVWNLVDNAVKYSPECPTVWADVERAGEFAAIRIRDRGIGIPPAEQARIFEKFVRGSAAKQSGIRGTGIGLATVQYIVAAHRGELRLESKAGEGSAFTVLLPTVN
jgi:signal transduction histidine kinase